MKYPRTSCDHSGHMTNNNIPLIKNMEQLHPSLILQDYYTKVLHIWYPVYMTGKVTANHFSTRDASSFCWHFDGEFQALVICKGERDKLF